MKKVVSILAFIFAGLCSVSAEPIITERFYLYNEFLHDESYVGVSNIMPSTLRLTLVRGEQTELYADVLPDDATETKLLWSLPENAGKIMIKPNGERCTIFGISEGEENIKIETEGGVSVNVAVEVTKPREITTRSFEFVGESKIKPQVFTEKMVRVIVRVLITLAAIILFAVVLFAVRQRRCKK